MKNWQLWFLISNLWLIAGTSQFMAVCFLILSFLAWFLIWMASISPMKQEIVGKFPDYQTCVLERDYQTRESQYFDKWACVQLPSATNPQPEHRSK